MWDRKIEAIIFDMDGTLVNTERLWTQAEAHMLMSYGRQYDIAIHRAFLGLTAEELIAKARIAYDLEHVSSQGMLETLNERVMFLLEAHTLPTEGAIELIEAVCSSDLKLALASNSSAKIIEATLKKQAWADCLEMRISIDEVQHGKPQPDMFLLAASRIGVEPSACIVVEDSVNGARAAQAADMICLAVPDAYYASHADFGGITPYLFESLRDIHHFLKENQLL